MKWNLVTFADDKFSNRQKYLEDYAKSLDIGTYSYSHSWFKKTDFYEKYKNYFTLMWVICFMKI